MDKQSNSTTAPFVSIGEAANDLIKKIAIGRQASLTEVINAYQKEWQAFLTDDSDDAPMAWKPLWQIIEGWDSPAQSEAEAKLALDLAIRNYEVGDTPAIPSLMKAARGYIDRPSLKSVADNVFCDVSDVATLVGTIHDLANDLRCVDDHGNYNRPLGDVIALLRIARDKSAQTAESVDRIAEGR